jgi:hypothetical protein
MNESRFKLIKLTLGATLLLGSVSVTSASVFWQSYSNAIRSLSPQRLLASLHSILEAGDSLTARDVLKTGGSLVKIGAAAYGVLYCMNYTHFAQVRALALDLGNPELDKMESLYSILQGLKCLSDSQQKEIMLIINSKIYKILGYEEPVLIDGKLISLEKPNILLTLHANSTLSHEYQVEQLISFRKLQIEAHHLGTPNLNTTNNGVLKLVNILCEACHPSQVTTNALEIVGKIIKNKIPQVLEYEANKLLWDRLTIREKLGDLRAFVLMGTDDYWFKRYYEAGIQKECFDYEEFFHNLREKVKEIIYQKLRDWDEIGEHQSKETGRADEPVLDLIYGY